MVLWLASIVVAGGGLLLMTTSNAREAAIYTAGKADYPKLFAAQSGSTIGGLLVAVGVLGALLALMSLTLAWRPPVTPQPSPLETGENSDEDSDEDRDDQDDQDDIVNETRDSAETPGYSSSGRRL